MKLYEGTLNRAKMHPVAKRAYKSWIDQGQRCNNPNDKGFEHWGKKGVKRVYSQREFISWYEHESAKFPSDVRLNVDRIDHSKSYSFVLLYENVWVTKASIVKNRY